MKKRIFAALLVLLLLLCACGAEEPWQAAYRRTGQALAAQEDYGVGSIGGVNLLEGLTDMAFVSYQGLNGPIWALIALDCGGYEIPDAQPGEEQATREALICLLLRERKADGGWCFSGDASDADMTAMALTALAPYRERGEVAEAIEGALQCLSEMQLENGCFASWGSENSESCAQVIVALTALGIDPQKDARFLKNGRSVLDALCDFVLDDGFYHSAELVEVNGMATEQAYYALTAYARFRDGKSRLFDMTELTAA